MEDHVGRVLTALLPLLVPLAASASVASLLQALEPGLACEAWAALAALLGLLATALAVGGRSTSSRPGALPAGRTQGLCRAPAGPLPRPALRALEVAFGIAGLLVALLLLGQTALVVGRAFLRGGPALTL